ncbi:MAG: electron transfer flavoprotein subunit alpha/FixB family protein [Caldilineaceae bacterium]
MILTFIEHDRGVLNGTTLETLTVGRRLAEQQNSPLHAILIGAAAQPLAAALQAYGVTVVHLVQHEQLDDYAPAAWAQSVVEIMANTQPMAVLAAGSDRGNEVMAHVAARTDLPLATNCTDVQLGEPCIVTRLRWGGSLLEEAQLNGAPALLTIAEHAVAAEEAPAGELTVHVVTPTLSASDWQVRIVSRVEATTGKVALADARVVVGGGRGVGSAAGFQILEALAAQLDGAVGCSRAVTSVGWRPHADQVGQTGTRIAPVLYIACGISGAIQHIVGCKGAKQILAINTDPNASIVAAADYAVIGDLHKVIPALVAALKQRK